MIFWPLTVDKKILTRNACQFFHIPRTINGQFYFCINKIQSPLDVRNCRKKKTLEELNDKRDCFATSLYSNG